MIASTTPIPGARQKQRPSSTDFSIEVQHAKNLVTLVESGSALNARSKTLQHVSAFTKEIAEKPEYQKLKRFVDSCYEELLGQYTKSVRSLRSITHLGMASTPADVVSALQDLGTGKGKALNANERRIAFKTITKLKSVVQKLVTDPGLEGLVDVEEIKTFEIEKNLDEILGVLGKTASVTYETRSERSAAQKYFFESMGNILEQIDKILTEGLNVVAGSLNISSTILSSELAFYCGLADLASYMERTSPVVMPKIDEKEKRSTRIIDSRVPSIIVGRARSSSLVPNDIVYNKGQRCFLITGANDNGKTTYERMIGQNQVLAQTGAFIPAKSARVSIVDGIFTALSGDDKPGEGRFKAGLSYLGYITVPQEKDETWQGRPARPLDIEEISLRAEMGDICFLTPYSLALLDEIGIGSDSEATEEAVKRTLTYGKKIGAAVYLSTHFHPIAEQVEQGNFPGVVNLGAPLKELDGKLVPTRKIVRGIHAPSHGNLIFEPAGFTEEAVKKGYKRLVEAGVINTS